MSKKIIWTAAYTVEVEEIDEQHRQFLDIADELRRLSELETVSQELVLTTVSKIGNYVLYHFGTEEAYFLQCRFVGAAVHVRDHDWFRAEVKKFIARAEKSDEDLRVLSRQVADFCGQWLLDHIMRMDKGYITTFKQCGLK